jgi:hypothetical protein
MSDAKWRKQIAVRASVPSIDRYFLTSIRSPTELQGYGFLSGNAPHAFIDSFSFGPIYLRDIEWLEFPVQVARRSNAPPSPGGHYQDIAGLRRALAMIGEFPLDEKPRGIRVVGHVRSAPTR